MPLKLKLGINPIIVKELRSRMRGGRAFATLTGALLLLGFTSYALYRMVLAATRYSSTPVSPMVGQTLFAGLVFLELMIICGVAPALTATAISGEQEKQTYDMLMATPMRPASILWGKLFSALSYVFLIIFAAVPMASLVFIFGGVSPRDMLKALMVLVVVAVMLGVLGLFMSALFRRSGRATVASYVTVVLLLFAPTFIAMATMIIRGSQVPRWMLVPSPLNALASTLSSAAASDNPFSVFAVIMQYFGGFAYGMMERPISMVSIPRPLYHYSLPLYGAIALVLYLLATRLVQPAHRWRIAWKEALLAVAILLGYVAVVAGVFMVSSSRYEGTNLFSSGVPTATPVAMMGVREVAVEAQAIGPYPGPATPTPLQDPYPLITPTSFQDPNQLITPTPWQDPNEYQAEVYEAVLRHVLEENPFYEGMDEHPIVWLVRRTDDSSGHPSYPISDSQTLPEEVLVILFDALNDIPVDLAWVEDTSQVALEGENSIVKDNGAIIRVGNIVQESETKAVVSASLYRSSGESGDFHTDTYVLEKTEEGWKVVGTWTP